VTGAASGIGAATMTLLVERGWRVVGADLEPQDRILRCDVTSTESVQAAVERCADENG
jgi:NAD(P)-dependent dehydrogenase (short-subunit alcohol dehydrogenase family)